MNGNELLDKMDLVKDEYIETADSFQAVKKKIKWQPIAVAACLLVAMGAYWGISKMEKGPDNQSNNAKIAKNENISTETTGEGEVDLSPVKYSEINLSGAKEFDYGDVSNGEELSLVAFDESMLKECKNNGNIIEGTVTNIYTKEYKFDTYDDKFEKNGVLHNIENTVVYEIKINKVWYGEYKEETILIEDYNYFCNAVWELKVGRKYVIPIVYEGDKIYRASWEEFKEGDCERDSVFVSLYPYNEPIEVTMDGYYLVSSEWPTLIMKNAKKVIMDVDGYESFHDIYMINGKSFQQQMEKLINETIKKK